MSAWSEEFQQQSDAVKWFRATWPEHTQALRVSMSGINLGGGRKAAIMVNQMRAQGVVDGEADIAILLPRKGYGSLLIEHKRDANSKPSEAQLDCCGYHNMVGNLSLVTHGLDELKTAIQEYME